MPWEFTLNLFEGETIEPGVTYDFDWSVKNTGSSDEYASFVLDFDGQNLCTQVLNKGSVLENPCFIDGSVPAGSIKSQAVFLSGSETAQLPAGTHTLAIWESSGYYDNPQKMLEKEVEVIQAGGIEPGKVSVNCTTGDLSVEEYDTVTFSANVQNDNGMAVDATVGFNYGGYTRSTMVTVPANSTKQASVEVYMDPSTISGINFPTTVSAALETVESEGG